MELVIAEPFGSSPEFVEAQAELIRRHLTGAPGEALVLTAHSLPMSVVNAGDPYRELVEASARGIAERLGRPFVLAYQSQGADGGDWLGPDLRRVLDGRPSIDLCVLAPNPFGRVLEQLIEGESLSGRRLAVRYVHADAVNACHLLYVPSGAAGRRALLRRIAASPILTVSDAPRFLDEGGMVQLTIVENRVRFEIGAGAAGRAGLRLSAQLLRLAVTVREEQP